jgi:hypothetical protein
MVCAVAREGSCGPPFLAGVVFWRAVVRTPESLCDAGSVNYAPRVGAGLVVARRSGLRLAAAKTAVCGVN